MILARLFIKGARILEFEKLREICGDFQQLNYAKGKSFVRLPYWQHSTAKIQVRFAYLWFALSYMTQTMLVLNIGMLHSLQPTHAANLLNNDCNVTTWSWTPSQPLRANAQL